MKEGRCADVFLEFDVDTFRRNLKLAALDNLDGVDRLVTTSGRAVLDLVDNVVALKDFAENDVTAIKPPVDGGGQPMCYSSNGV